MRSKRRIAVLIAALFLGTQVGMAALDESAAYSEAQEQDSVAAQEQDSIAAQEQDSVAALEQSAISTPTENESAESARPLPAVAEQSEQPAVAEQSEQKASSRIAAIRDRISNFFAATRDSNVFPRSADERELLPALARYLEQRAASTNLTGAPGNVFPPSADELQMLPALAQYLDGKAASINLAMYENSVADLSE